MEPEETWIDPAEELSELMRRQSVENAATFREGARSVELGLRESMDSALGFITEGAHALPDAPPEAEPPEMMVTMRRQSESLQRSFCDSAQRVLEQTRQAQKVLQQQLALGGSLHLETPHERRQLAERRKLEKMQRTEAAAARLAEEEEAERAVRLAEAARQAREERKRREIQKRADAAAAKASEAAAAEAARRRLVEEKAAARRAAEAEAVRLARLPGAALMVQTRWRGYKARRAAAEELAYWDAMIENDAASRVQAMWRGRKHRLAGSALRLANAVVQAGHTRVPNAATARGGVAHAETERRAEEVPLADLQTAVLFALLLALTALLQEVWRGELETASLPSADDQKQSKKGGRLSRLKKAFNTAEFVWRGGFGVLYAFGQRPRLEVFATENAAEDEQQEHLLCIPLGHHVDVRQEQEDKGGTVLLCLRPAGQGEAEAEQGALRLRLHDRLRVALGEETTVAVAFREGLEKAVPSYEVTF